MKKEPDITKCIPILKEYSLFCDDWSKEFDGKQLNRVETYLMTLLLRFGIISNSLIVLLPHYFNNQHFKFPVSLLLRSINTDYLTIIYLLTFYSNNDSDQISMQNEITLMDIDFLKSMEKFSKEEVEFYSKIIEAQPNLVDPLTKLKNMHHKFFPECYENHNGKLKLKSTSEIRKTSNQKLFENLQEINNPLTDTSKYERLKSRKGDEYGIHAFLAFKYYSQFQHPSSSNKSLLESESELLDKFLFLQTLEHLVLGTQAVMKFYFKKENQYSEKMTNLQKKLLELCK
jgi:hypothetical protein